jgi:small subunit ribosomal protein S16
MSTRIRLRRLGASKRPYYRVVVADQRSPRDGRFIENIGKYHPLEDPSLIEIDEGRALYWLRVGAQPSDQVLNLLRKIGIWEKFVTERPSAEAKRGGPKPERPERTRVSKKAQAKAAEAAAQPPVEEASSDAAAPSSGGSAGEEGESTEAEPTEAEPTEAEPTPEEPDQA